MLTLKLDSFFGGQVTLADVKLMGLNFIVFCAAGDKIKGVELIRLSSLTKVNAYVNIGVKEASMSRIKSIGMAEARPRLTQLVDEVSGGGEPYLIVSGSQVKAVLIGINHYNDMLERLEDLSDAAELLQAELGQESTIPFEEHLTKSKELKNSVSTGS